MSKLYTEEQLRDAIAFGNISRPNITNDDWIKRQTPIELPTLENIELKSVEYSTNTETKEFYKDCCWDFQNGAKWMRDKIQGGNNE